MLPAPARLPPEGRNIDPFGGRQSHARHPPDGHSGDLSCGPSHLRARRQVAIQENPPVGAAPIFVGICWMC